MGFPGMQESTWPVVFTQRKMEGEEVGKMCLLSRWLTLWRTTKSSMNVTNDHDFSFFLMANVLTFTTDFCLRDKWFEVLYWSGIFCQHDIVFVWGPKTLNSDIKHVFVTTTTDQILSLVNYCTWNERPHQLYFFKWCFPNCQLLSRKQCTL